MTPAEIQVKINIAQREADFWREILRRKSCKDCVHFANAPQCAMANGAVPPSDVQRTGCPSWSWDEIPF